MLKNLLFDNCKGVFFTILPVFLLTLCSFLAFCDSRPNLLNRKKKLMENVIDFCLSSSTIKIVIKHI